MSPSIHEYDNVFIHSGLGAACDERLGRESIDPELTTEGRRVERLSLAE
jgi:hypothetical protein